MDNDENYIWDEAVSLAAWWDQTAKVSGWFDELQPDGTPYPVVPTGGSSDISLGVGREDDPLRAYDPITQYYDAARRNRRPRILLLPWVRRKLLRPQESLRPPINLRAAFNLRPPINLEGRVPINLVRPRIRLLEPVDSGS